jgi:tetratricopeptide (TPR) repeat protein
MHLLFLAMTLLAGATTAPTTQPPSDDEFSAGMAALRAGDNAGAVAHLEAFLAPLPKSAKPQTDEQAIALHGLAVAYMRGGDYGKAREPMDRAFAYGKTNRALMLNHAKLDLRMRGLVVRAVKDIDKVLEVGPIDEQTVNLLGAAIQKASSNTADRGQVAPFAAKYDNYNAKLEATRPGWKHFGSAWMKQRDYDYKVNNSLLVSERESARVKLKTAREKLEQADKELASAKHQAYMDQTNHHIQRFPDGRPVYLVHAQDKYDAAKRDVDWATQRLAGIEAKFPQPTWVEELDPALPDIVLLEKP